MADVEEMRVIEAPAEESIVPVVKLNQLDSEGFFISDFIVGVSGPLPENWTKDLVSDGFWKAQYQGATRNPTTGEWTGGHWVETSGPSHEDQVAEATGTKAALMAEASAAIAPLQDAVDLDMATPEEVALLKAWKLYRVQVNRVDVNLAPNIVWPTKPGESA